MSVTYSGCLASETKTRDDSDPRSSVAGDQQVVRSVRTVAAIFRRRTDRQSLRRAFSVSGPTSRASAERAGFQGRGDPATKGRASQAGEPAVELVLISEYGKELIDGSVSVDVVVLDNYAPRAKKIYEAVRRRDPSCRVIVVSDTPDTLFSLTIPRHLVALREASESVEDLLLRIVIRSPLRTPTASARNGSKARGLSAKQAVSEAEAHKRLLSRLGRKKLGMTTSVSGAAGTVSSSVLTPISTRPASERNNALRQPSQQTRVQKTVARSHVVIGSSTGGPEALKAVLKGLPASFPLPVLVVQHMPAGFTAALAHRLDLAVPLHVQEAEPGVMPRGGEVWIAPGDEHLIIADVTGQLGFSHAPKVNGCRPAVDVLFESAARAFGQRVVAVVLTGMGQDGTEGCRQIAAAGGHLIVQDEQTSTVWGMPGSVVKSNLNPEVAPLEQIALKIRAQTPRGQRERTRSQNVRGTQ